MDVQVCTGSSFAAGDDLRLDGVFDRASVGTAGFNGTDDLLGLEVAIGNGTKDDVLSVEPRGDDGGDEELGAVTASVCSVRRRMAEDKKSRNVRVRTSVCH